MKKSLPLALLLVAAVCGLLVFLGGDSEIQELSGPVAIDGEDVPVAPVDIPEEGPEPTPVVEPSDDPREEPSVAPAPRPAQAPVIDEAPAAEATPADGPRLTGTVTVSDPQGIVHSQTSGSFTLLLWEGGSGQHHEVTVTDGRFETEFPPKRRFTELEVQDLKLDGKHAVPVTPADRFALPPDGRLAIEARWAAPSMLRVKAADTGVDLEDVEVVHVKDWKRQDYQHPGMRGMRVLARGRSPLLLKRGSRNARTTVHARAPGYAWGRIEINFDYGGERILTLEPAGALEVQLDGAKPDPEAMLRLYTGPGLAKGRPICAVKVRDRSMVLIDALAPGRYPLQVEVGDWFSEPFVQGKSEVTIVAGERATAHVTLTAPPTTARATLAGVLVIPPEWKEKDPQLTLEGLEGDFNKDLKLVKNPDEPGSYRWALADVPVGKYELETYHPRKKMVVVLPPEGLEDVRMEVSPPADVEVRVVDDKGVDIAVPSVSWHPQVTSESRGWSSMEAPRNPDTGRFVFRAPLGKINISDFSDRYSFHATIEVRPGLNQHTITAKRNCGFLLLLDDGGTRVPWDDNYRLKVEAVGHDGRARGWGGRGIGHRVTVSKPGTYRLKLPEIDGYVTIPPQTVVVPAGTYVDHVVQLQRR